MKVPPDEQGPSSKSTPRVGELNFLRLPIVAGKGVQRQGTTYRVATPWALAHFGRIALKGGWWSVACKPNGMGHAELRLSAPRDPLIAIRLQEDSQVRVRLSSDVYDVSLLVTAWPGEVSFDELAFRSIGLVGEVKLVAGMVARLSTRKRPLEIFMRTFRRLIAGQSVGFRASSSAPAVSVADNPKQTADLPQERRVCRDGITGILRKGDQLHRDAFRLVADEFERRPDLHAVYGDVEDCGKILPHPTWDTVLASHFPYSDAPYFLRSDSVFAVEGASLATIAQRHGPTAIGRIALPLTRRQRAIVSPLPTLGPPVLARSPQVTAVIPTKFRMDLLQLCLEGLERNTAYPNLQVVVVDNGARDPRLHSILRDTSRKMHLVKVEDFGAFNFSRLINKGVEKSSGEIILLLNDDVVAREPGWLHRIVESAMKQNVGAVGAKLLYPDGSIQHAGVTLGLGGVCGHLWKGTPGSVSAMNPYTSLPSSRLAVTAACLGVRRDVFNEVSGLDESFPVAFNDIDFCLRLRSRGYRNVYRSDACLIHYESQSRGNDDASLSRRRRLLRETNAFLGRWGHLVDHDPFGSPAFDLTTESGAVHPAAWSSPENYSEPI